MARKQKNIHYLYKTTCLITGRYYIGMHSTSNLDDGYMGSGKRLRYSLRKHGIDNHVKEILEFFETRELLIEAEKKAITSEMLTDNNCMNIMSGGTGGFISVEACSKGGRNGAIKTNHINWVINGEKNKNKMSDKFKDLWKNSDYIDKMLKRKSWFGKQHTEETKEKMRKTKNVGETNSQCGTCWITKDGLNRKIKKEDIETYLKDGWVKGRTITKKIKTNVL